MRVKHHAPNIASLTQQSRSEPTEIKLQVNYLIIPMTSEPLAYLSAEKIGLRSKDDAKKVQKSRVT